MTSFYHSTRSGRDSVTSKQAILAGMAPDGGLYVSDDVWDAPLDLARVCGQGFRENARDVLAALLPDYTGDELAACVEGAYFAGQWDAPGVCPATPLGSDWLLELYHGPTCAFKDVALQMLPQLMSRARTAGGQQVMIVTATSGDTGKAALEGFADVKGTGVTVFYPEGKVSEVQRLQMVTQRGSNVAVCAVRGNFDDCQGEVKRIFADRALAGRLAERGVALSSANSINVGRLAPQVTYYFDSYAQLVRAGAVRRGDEVSFCVPTGNFGDVLAGYYAKRLGLPVRRLIVASNTNDVLFDFIRTGVYDRRRDFVKTISPSMDILVSSNLERLLYFASDGDCELVAALMDDLAQKGVYTAPARVMEPIQELFDCGWADDEATRATIRSTFDELGVLIDTHTAVAKNVLDGGPAGDGVRVCLSTASPFKFAADVLAALGTDSGGLGAYDALRLLEEATGKAAPEPLKLVVAAQGPAPAAEGPRVLHSDVCDRADMGAYVEAACERAFS